MGETDKEIARSLDISYATVKCYMLRLTKKTGASNRLEKMILGMALGLPCPLLETFRERFSQGLVAGEAARIPYVHRIAEAIGERNGVSA